MTSDRSGARSGGGHDNRCYEPLYCLTARSLNPALKIIARASEEDAEKHLLKAGADSVVSPYSFAGQRIAQSFPSRTCGEFS